MLPVAEKYHMGVIPWSPLSGGWLTGRYRKGQDAPDTHRSKMMGGRDLETPENAAKLDAVEQLAVLAEDTGISLIHLALAFVIQHPGVTAPIIGPRTMEQLETQLGAADVRLGTDVLDRIDEIVAPGTNVGGSADIGYAPDALGDPFLRRRRTA